MENLVAGFAEALQWTNLIACAIGVLVGTLVGVLPGLGPVATMAILLPFTFTMSPTAGIIMMAGVYYGAMYGGSTTSILFRTPGEAASILTSIDGYELAKKGRAGAALAISTIGSFVAGTIGVVGLMLFAPALARVAVAFGPGELLLVAFAALLLLANILGGSASRNLLIALVGVALGTVGLDSFSGASRYTFGFSPLLGGFDLVAAIMGLYGISELISIARNPHGAKRVASVRLRDLYPSKDEMKRSTGPILRGGVIGFGVGLTPGPAAVLAPLVSYFVERRLSKTPERFGKGAIEGVASAESANNSACSGALVPLLALGIPMTPAAAVLMSGFMIHGVAPGPLLMEKHALLFWGVVASMYIGNALLLVLNLPLVGVFARAMMTPFPILVPGIFVLCMVGAYSINNSIFDVTVMVLFGLLGDWMRRRGLDPMPLVLGMVLGPIVEASLRQSLILGSGSIGWFFGSNLRAVLFVLSIFLVLYSVVKDIRKPAKPAAGPAADEKTGLHA
ncbi:MAG: tripartite tricarboxylate transporter permease [Bacillota bacterium]|nr:MAG: tripartite tricarboxylate transporter permease [Bacillota bacterium]